MFDLKSSSKASGVSLQKLSKKELIEYNANKVAEYEKEIYDLKQLIEISRSFCKNFELNSLIESILYIAMAQMRVLGAGVFVLHSFDSTSFKLANNYSGLNVDKSMEYKIPISSPLVDYLVGNGATYSLDRIKSELPDCEDIGVIESLHPSLVVPLKLKNRLIGIILMGERIQLDELSVEYDDYELNEIATIASLASVALHNASLVEQSSTDMMTKLKLKFFFFNYLELKLDIALAQNRVLSVMMFDIDFFKKFNDTYGHSCGDYVLQTVAQLIRDNIREGDMASRYGGEEFTVMLCDATETDAYYVAERIRKNIESYDFVFEGNRMHVTISGGISTFSLENNPIRSPKDLVCQADEALYISKNNGRNQITILKHEKQSV